MTLSQLLARDGYELRGAPWDGTRGPSSRPMWAKQDADLPIEHGWWTEMALSPLDRRQAGVSKHRQVGRES